MIEFDCVALLTRFGKGGRRFIMEDKKTKRHCLLSRQFNSADKGELSLDVQQRARTWSYLLHKYVLGEVPLSSSPL